MGAYFTFKNKTNAYSRTDYDFMITVKCYGLGARWLRSCSDLRELPVSPSQPAQTLMEKWVDLVLLHRAGQVQRGERASVVIAACAREGERHHRSLLPLWQEVQQCLPHGPVLKHTRLLLLYIHTHNIKKHIDQMLRCDNTYKSYTCTSAPLWRVSPLLNTSEEREWASELED